VKGRQRVGRGRIGRDSSTAAAPGRMPLTSNEALVPPSCSSSKCTPGYSTSAIMSRWKVPRKSATMTVSHLSVVAWGVRAGVYQVRGPQVDEGLATAGPLRLPVAFAISY
jgi:hypothetical protein